VRENLDNW